MKQIGSTLIKRNKIPLLVSAAVVLSGMSGYGGTDTSAQSQPADDLWNRPTLLGGPGSEKEKLAGAGVDLNGWVTQTPYLLQGGEGGYGGKITITGNFDGEKLGLWQGFSASAIYERNFGEDPAYGDDGLLLPTNAILAFPRLGGYADDFTFNVTQRFGEDFSVSLGKFNLLHMVSKNPIVGGGGEETFLHGAFAGPVTGIVPPYLLGGVFKYNADPVDLTLMVFDPRIATIPDVLSDPFSDGVSISLQATLKTRVRDLPGYYGIRGVYSTAEGTDLSRIPEFVELPPEARGALTEKGYWYVNVNAYQYLSEFAGQPGKGWGLFAYASISDGNPNMYEWSAWGGLAGNSPLPGRSMDKWGLGYFRYGLSSDLADGLDTLGIPTGDEHGVEAFYNYAVTPWLQVSADFQWIDSFKSDRGDEVIGTMRIRTLF